MNSINRYLQEDRSFEKKNSVKAIIKNDEDQILILRRANNDAGGGGWDIPGGAIEAGENQIDALKREVYEETNLKIDTIKSITKPTLKIPETGVHSVMNLYTCRCHDTAHIHLKPATWKGANGKPEHTEYKWIKLKSDLENLTMISQIKIPLMKKLQDISE